MAQKWNERPKSNRWMIVGAIVGMIISGIVAFIVAFDDSTMVRYLIMAAGTIIGGGIGMAAASLAERR